MSAKVIPISELPADFGDSTIAWQMDPGAYVNAERIGLHVPATERLIRAAGLSGAVFRQYHGDAAEYQTNISGVGGVGGDGSATATGRVAVSKAATQRNAFQPEGGFIPFQCRWPVADVEVNRSEIASRMATDVRRGMSREAAWIKHNDAAIRRGLAERAFAGLIKDPIKSNRQPILSAGLLGIMLALGITSGSYYTIGFAEAAYQLTSRHMARMLSSSPLKLSLFPYGFQPDRFAVAAAMAGTSRLLRPIR